MGKSGAAPDETPPDSGCQLIQAYNLNKIRAGNFRQSTPSGSGHPVRGESSQESCQFSAPALDDRLQFLPLLLAIAPE
jgi:hypothetical protein